MRKILIHIGKWLLKRAGYSRVGNRKRRNAAKLSSMMERQRIVRGVRRFFEENYELRYNLMKQVEEFRPKSEKALPNSQKALPNSQKALPNSQKALPNSKEAVPISQKGKPLSKGDGHSWRQLTDRVLRQMAIEEMEQMGVAWSIDVELYVRSALIPPYNPVADYLDGCGAWDGQTDHIRALARRVPTRYSRWPDFFHRWLLAMVAQWLNLSRDFGNAVVPLLIGGQGSHKTTFCKLILPPELREYYIDDIKLGSAEQVERMLGRMLLVNIDEYNAKTDREQAQIKRVLSEKDVQTRRMRSDQYVMLPRMASFIATTNEREPLTDRTGSRRYLCCEMTGIIDTDTPIDHRQLYAQAVAELRQGATWHFSKAEEAELARHNLDFLCHTSAETVLLSYFKPAARHQDHFIRAVDILAELRQHVKAADVPTIKKLTLALKACHFAHGKHLGERGWYARRRT